MRINCKLYTGTILLGGFFIERGAHGFETHPFVIGVGTTFIILGIIGFIFFSKPEK